MYRCREILLIILLQVVIVFLFLKPYINFTSVKSAEFENKTSRVGRTQTRNEINKHIDTGQHGVRQDLKHTDGSQKVERISFLKVQKSGSSTVACIFIRFGVNNNLSMFLPVQPSISRKKQNLLLEQKKHYDIFIIHTHYNYNFFTNIVHNPTIIGLVRRPETRLVSHAFFFGLAKKYENLKELSRQDFINELVTNTSRYGVQNIMGSFFGLNDLSLSEQSLRKQLLKLNSEFTLVLILERLDESLIILKRLLRWSLFDIIYAAKKTRHRNTVHLNASQISHLEVTNNIEYAIYNFFYEELERKIQNAGKDFMQEVANFKNILNQTREFCDLKNGNDEPFYTFPASMWDDSFTISKSDCFIIFKNDVTQLKSGRLTEF